MSRHQGWGLFKFKSVRCLEIIFFIQVFQLNVLVYNGCLLVFWTGTLKRVWGPELATQVTVGAVSTGRWGQGGDEPGQCPSLAFSTQIEEAGPLGEEVCFL